MGQVPSKYMLPSAPYGQSDAMNSVNAVQPAAMNPQTPLLPPSFTSPGTSATAATAPQNPFAMNPVRNPSLGGLQQMYSGLYRQ